MGKYKPCIGITPGYNYYEKVLSIKSGYTHGIIEAGGLPVLLPMTWDTGMLDEIIDRWDGFLISGGPDIDAVHYGQGNLPCTGEISPYRDYIELYIAKKAIEKNKPVLGICRGIQVLNVAMGGTLYQDISAQLPHLKLMNHNQQAPKWYPIHEIRIEKNSRVWMSFNGSEARVNSFHHQAVKDVAPGFVVTSRTGDGLIESIEYEGHRFAVGVQWHPEVMWEHDAVHLELFKMLVKASMEAAK